MIRYAGSAVAQIQRNKKMSYSVIVQMITYQEDICPEIGCLRSTKLCWVGKHINVIMKPTDSPTQGQPNPRKVRLKSVIWATFSQSKYFFVGWDWFHVGNRLQET